MIKLIAMDLDGTLFDDDHINISKRNVNAITKAYNKGINIVIATGRTMCQMDSVLKQIPVSYVITSNGASSFDINGNPIASDGIDFDTWSKIYNILDENNIVTEVFYNGKTYLKSSQKDDYKNPYLSSILLDSLKTVINFCDDPIESLKGKSIEKLSSIYVPGNIYDLIKSKFEQMDMAVTSSVPYNMEINKKGVNKGKGLDKLCSVLNINSSEVMAFGDGNNDVEMLLWAENSYAMENAVNEAKIAAKFLADTNYNDGIAKVVEKIL
ncbi:MAG: Cof-type HAD-IIB family hydrolase [Lachnospirales bacterium]